MTSNKAIQRTVLADVLGDWDVESPEKSQCDFRDLIPENPA